MFHNLVGKMLLGTGLDKLHDTDWCLKFMLRLLVQLLAVSRTYRMANMAFHILSRIKIVKACFEML